MENAPYNYDLKLSREFLQNAVLLYKKLRIMETMNRIFRYAFWKLKGTKVYALVGKSGTGKSFRSKLVAQKYGIDLIIDDGLLIRGDRILAGKSAKREMNVLSAVRTAVYDDAEHQEQVIQALQKEKYHKVLIIGTSEKMVYKIASRLNLPQPEKLYRIEDIASKEEIETAMRIRYTEGKHVIPVPSLEITRNYPQIVYDTMRVFFKNKHRYPFNKKNMSFEKTLVRPEFSKYGKVTVSEAALTQMVAH
jgi:adenylate kinase family enzyme